MTTLNVHEQAGLDPNSGDSPLVLIVEDNDKNARLLATMLKGAGYQVRLAMDGSEGARMTCELLPAMILTDLQMPGMDGLEMTRILKARPDTCSIPIIAVTAHALDEHREQALAAGCCNFISKPFRYRDLLAEVARAIGRELTHV